MDSLESFEAVIAADAVAQVVSGTNETIQERANPPAVDATNEQVQFDLNPIEIIVPQPEVEKVEETVESEVVQIEQAVVAEVEKVVELFQYDVLEPAKEGFVAGEHLVRKVLDVVVGSSRIRNPA